LSQWEAREEPDKDNAATTFADSPFFEASLSRILHEFVVKKTLDEFEKKFTQERHVFNHLRMRLQAQVDTRLVLWPRSGSSFAIPPPLKEAEDFIFPVVHTTNPTGEHYVPSDSLEF
jgi:hypothetical protein